MFGESAGPREATAAPADGWTSASGTLRHSLTAAENLAVIHDRMSRPPARWVLRDPMCYTRVRQCAAKRPRHRARRRHRAAASRPQAAASDSDGSPYPADDLTKSLCVCYAAVGERVARGRRPWRPRPCRCRCCSEVQS
jgi:hypothetical protein